MEKITKNNQAILSGEITKGFGFDHEVYGERFYMTEISVMRNSGVEDMVPVMVSACLIPIDEDWTGKLVTVRGQFRSHNKHIGEKTRLILYVFAQAVDILDEIEESKNKIFLDGYICKEPVYRETPKRREITDILFAVNRQYGKSDYIPCIAWGRNARVAQQFGIGTHLKIEGRIQSREYQKQVSETEFERRTAYEVSVSKLEVVEDEQDRY